MSWNIWLVLHGKDAIEPRRAEQLGAVASSCARLVPAANCIFNVFHIFWFHSSSALQFWSELANITNLLRCDIACVCLPFNIWPFCVYVCVCVSFAFLFFVMSIEWVSLPLLLQCVACAFLLNPVDPTCEALNVLACFPSWHFAVAVGVGLACSLLSFCTSSVLLIHVFHRLGYTGR